MPEEMPAGETAGAGDTASEESTRAKGLPPTALDGLTERVHRLLRDDLRRQRERGGATIARWR